MKKSIFTAFALFSLFSFAKAQDRLDFAKSEALWFDSNNAAGLSALPFEKISSLSFKYDYRAGDYRLKQEGARTGILGVDTQGALKVDKIQVWGRFSYDNVSDNGSRYNSLVYDPLDKRKIYGVADTTLSTWKRQSYDMEFKASMPLWKDILFGGVNIRYIDRIASKQHDPRAESYLYELTVRPSLMAVLGNIGIGVSLHYSNSSERSVPSLSNSQQLQNVFILRGLGNYTEDFVGSSGMGTMIYGTSAYGGALQLSFSDKFLFETGVESSSTQLRQGTTEPRAMNRADISDLFMNASYLLKTSGLHKFSLKTLYGNSSGTEYSTKAEPGVGWVIATESVMSLYNTFKALASYEGYIKEGDKLKWILDAELGFCSKEDKFILPEAFFRWSSINAGLGAARIFFPAKGLSMRMGASLSASKGLGGEYSYTGDKAESKIVKDWLPHDLSIRKSDSLRGGLSSDFGFKLDRFGEMHFALSAAYLHSSLSLSRTFVTSSLYLVF